MAEEHHIANLDPSAFFTLHDFDNDGSWSGDEIRRTYGLDDESSNDVEETKKAAVVKVVKDLFDKDRDGVISREEWMEGWMNEGKRLPDFGVGITGSCRVHTDMEEVDGDWGGDENEVPAWLVPCLEYLLLQEGWQPIVDAIPWASLAARLAIETATEELN